MSGANAPYTELDSTQVLRHVFDETQDRLRVDAAVSMDAGQLDVVIDQADDSIRIGDGTNLVTTTQDSGKVALDVNIISSDILNAKLTPNGTTISTYNEITSVSSSSLTVITTYTVPSIGSFYLVRTEYSGNNIATYYLTINDVVIDKKNTYFSGNLDTTTDFNATLSLGLEVYAGDIIQTKVIHSRPNPGDFSSRILIVGI